MRLLFLMSIVFLSGCLGTSNISHRYQPTPTPKLAGYWVGTGPSTTQYALIRGDGTGMLCWENLGSYKSTQLVISGDKMATLVEGEFKRNADGTFSDCYWGACANYRRIEQKRVPTQCNQFFNG